ncbi:hypothetical protein NXS99_09075, partial [Corynebacterium sp. HS2168-gen11]|nr:hypothetical protein [Corynebacterium sp. HS2168-gen11]
MAKKNRWVRHVFTPTIAVLSTLAIVGGGVSPVAQAQATLGNDPYNGPARTTAGDRNDGRVFPPRNPAQSVSNSVWEKVSPTEMRGWPTIGTLAPDLAGADPYTVLKGAPGSFTMTWDTPSLAFGTPSRGNRYPYEAPNAGDWDGANFNFAGKAAYDAAAATYPNCNLPEGNEEGIDAATAQVAGQQFHCKVTDANALKGRIVFDKPTWDPTVTFANLFADRYYGDKDGGAGGAVQTYMDFRITKVDDLDFSNPATWDTPAGRRVFAAFESRYNASGKNHAGVYRTDKGIEVRIRRDGYETADGIVTEYKNASPTNTYWKSNRDNGVTFPGHVSNIEFEILPTLMTLQDKELRGATPFETFSNLSAHAVNVLHSTSDLKVTKNVYELDGTTPKPVSEPGDELVWKIRVNREAGNDSLGYILTDNVPEYIDPASIEIIGKDLPRVPDGYEASIDGSVITIKRVQPGYTIAPDPNFPMFAPVAAVDANHYVSPDFVLQQGDVDVYTIKGRIKPNTAVDDIVNVTNTVKVVASTLDYNQANNVSEAVTKLNPKDPVPAKTVAYVGETQTSADADPKKYYEGTDKEVSDAGRNGEDGADDKMFPGITDSTYTLATTEAFAEDGVTPAGSFAIDPETGVVTFTPLPNFAGKVKPAEITATPKDGSKARTSTYAPLVIPRVENLSTEGAVGEPITVSPVADTQNRGIDPTSLKFPAEGQPANAVLSADGKTLTVAGIGVWTISPEGAFTFTPEGDYEGDIPDVSYVGTAKDGTPVETPATVSYKASKLNPAEQFAKPGTTIESVPVPALPEAADPKTFGFIDPANPTADPVKSLEVPGEGTWTVNPDGTVKFEPLPEFKGIPAPVGIGAKTKNGNVVKASTVTIFPILTSVDALDKPQTSTDDAAGDDTLPQEKQFPALKDKTFTAAFDDGSTTKTTDQGEFVVDPKTGVVTFTP